jgi:hypothetical protein
MGFSYLQRDRWRDGVEASFILFKVMDWIVKFIGFFLLSPPSVWPISKRCVCACIPKSLIHILCSARKYGNQISHEHSKLPISYQELCGRRWRESTLNGSIIVCLFFMSCIIYSKLSIILLFCFIFLIFIKFQQQQQIDALVRRE